MPIIGLARLAGAKNIFSAGIILVFLTAFFVGGQLAGISDAKARALETIELLPPRYNATQWLLTTSGQNYTFTFRIDILEAGNRTMDEAKSEIMDFGIIIIERNPEGSKHIKVYPYRPDPITGDDYGIPINFTKLIGEPVTIINGPSGDNWGGSNHSYSVDDRDVEGFGWLVRDDERHAYINGTLTLNNWSEDKYHIVVWAVDDFGNARITTYPIKNGTTTNNNTNKQKAVTTENIKGRESPTGPWENRFYTINDEAYIPYIRRDFEYQPCIILYIPPNTSFTLPNTTIEASPSLWVYFTTRLEIFSEEMGRVGDVVIRFFVDTYLPAVETYLLIGTLWVLINVPLYLSLSDEAGGTVE